jgi:SAM-dependent methyltransferase
MSTENSGPLVQCPTCGGADLVDLYVARDPRFSFPEHFRVMWCDHCAIASTQPRISPRELARFYPDDYDPYRDNLAKRTRSRVHRALLRVEDQFAAGATDDLPVGSLLDVGCGNGQYMAAMARRGFTVAGVEISPLASRRVVARGLRVINGDFLEVNLPAGSFDILTMNHYLEHSLDPRASLEKAHRLLRPSGRLVVGVPNFASWERRHFGAHWSDLEVPRHVSHFTPEGLARLLTGCGFHLYKTQYEAASDSGSIATSFLVKMGRQDDAFARRLFTLLHLILYPIGLPLAEFRQSAWIRVFATRS